MSQLSSAPASALSSSLSGQSLDTGTLLRALEQDGLTNTDASRAVAMSKALYPLRAIANANLEDLKAGGKKLDYIRLQNWLADKAGQQAYHIDPLKIDVAAITEVMSFAFAQRHNILAVESTVSEVVIASSQPFISGWREHLEPVLKRPIRQVLANPEDIERYRVEFYSLAKSVAGASGEKGRSNVVTNFEQLLELTDLKEVDANDRNVVSIVDWLLQYAFDQRASDIHIEPRREKGTVRFRIDGVLYNVYELPAQVLAAVTSRIKILGRMDVAEKRRPQDGRLKTVAPDGGEVELRLSTLPTAFGEKMVMRIFDPEVLLRSFEDLGLRGEDYQRWQNMVSRPHGIVLVTGPTGSGKTTTLYSSLKQLATDRVNVCTIEDPIEMVEGSFNQMQVQHKIGLDFASGVRALLRQDPDIIMIGEIRDLETAEMAVQAALTGHLVLATLHTNDAPSAITRLLELGVAPYLVRATVLGVMAQRLVRTLCPHCKTPAPVDQSGWQQLTAPWKVGTPKQPHQLEGCLECRNTGYLGRQGIYEILPLSPAVQAHIQTDIDLRELRQQAMKEGMRTLRLSGAQKISKGETTIEEVMRVAPPPTNDA